MTKRTLFLEIETQSYQSLVAPWGKVEQRPFKAWVLGSNPSGLTIGDFSSGKAERETAMEDSRSLQPSGALVPRAALPSQSTTDFHFVCRACGGSEFHVETRRGVEVALASLRIYQAVGFSDLAGRHSLYTCIRCEAAVLEAQNRMRETLVGKLLFAAKHLAEHQFTRSNRYGRVELICVECRSVQVADSYLRHENHCRVGRVLGLLQGLMSIDDPILLHGALGCGVGTLSLHSDAAAAEMGGVQ